MTPFGFIDDSLPDDRGGAGHYGTNRDEGRTPERVRGSDSGDAVGGHDPENHSYEICRLRPACLGGIPPALKRHLSIHLADGITEISLIQKNDEREPICRWITRVRGAWRRRR